MLQPYHRRYAGAVSIEAPAAAQRRNAAFHAIGKHCGNFGKMRLRPSQLLHQTVPPLLPMHAQRLPESARLEGERVTRFPEACPRYTEIAAHDSRPGLRSRSTWRRDAPTGRTRRTVHGRPPSAPGFPNGSRFREPRKDCP